MATTPLAPIAIPEWKRPLLHLSLLALTTTLLFWFTNLDIWVSAWFFNPDSASDPWPYAHYPLWRLFYHGAPLLAGLLALLTAALFLVSLFTAHRYAWRRPAILVLLTLALGPGLLVNFILKDHWGRPRPWQIENFHGNQAYLPPLALGNSDQHKSFPSGHAALGFSFCVFWLLWRTQRPQLATLSLIGSVLLGLLMGLGRIAEGAHFLSDILWAGYLTFFTALAVYYWLLPTPITHHHPAARSAGFWYGGLGLMIAGGALVNLPVEDSVTYQAPLHWQPDTVRLELQQAAVTLYLNDAATPPLHVQAQVRGFGLPNYRLDSRGEWDAGNKTLSYWFKPRGFFTELDTQLQANIGTISRLVVRVQTGDIRVYTRGQLPLPELDLQTRQGQVFSPLQAPPL